MLLTTTAVATTTGAAGTTGGLTGVISIASKLAPVFTKLLSGEVFSKTIGQIKDGFDCWGSTWTPTRAKNELPEWMEELAEGLQIAVEAPENQLEQSVNNYFADEMWDRRLASATLEGWIGWRYDTAKDCTLRGLKDLEKGVDAYILEMAKTLKSELAKLGYEATYSMVTTNLRRNGTSGKSYTKRVPQFTIRKKSVWSGGALGGSGGSVKPSQMGVGIILLIAAILFGAKKFK